MTLRRAANKDERIHIRLDIDTKAMLAKHARERGCSMSTLLVQCWLKEFRRDRRAG